MEENDEQLLQTKLQGKLQLTADGWLRKRVCNLGLNRYTLDKSLCRGFNNNKGITFILDRPKRFRSRHFN